MLLIVCEYICTSECVYTYIYISNLNDRINIIQLAAGSLYYDKEKTFLPNGK